METIFVVSKTSGHIFKIIHKVINFIQWGLQTGLKEKQVRRSNLLQDGSVFLGQTQSGLYDYSVSCPLSVEKNPICGKFQSSKLKNSKNSSSVTNRDREV